MKNKITTIFVGLIIIISFIACPEPSVDSTESNPYLQEHIEWPSLANSPWPMYLHDPQHTGRSPYIGPQDGEVDWMIETGGNIYASPAIGTDGTIYFTSEDGFIYAVDPSGELIWSFITGGGSDSSPLITSDGRIYFTSSDGFLYCLGEDGQLIWSYELSCGTWNTQPTISKNGNIVFLQAPCGSIKKFYSITREGILRWELDIPGLAPHSPAFSLEGTILYVPVSGGLTAIDTNGVIQWSYHVLPSSSEWSNSPSVDNSGNIYFVNESYCLSITPDGELRWQFKTISVMPGITPTIGEDGTIYVAGMSNNPDSFWEMGIYAFTNTGDFKWFYLTGYFKHVLTPVTIDAEGTLYAGMSTSRTLADTINFLILNPDGTLKHHVTLKTPQEEGIPEYFRYPDIDSPPVIGSYGNIYVGSDRPRGFHIFSIK